MKRLIAEKLSRLLILWFDAKKTFTALSQFKCVRGNKIAIDEKTAKFEIYFEIFKYLQHNNRIEREKRR